ncbi:YbaK/EbsC family protein [Bacillus sp. FSL K6-3431]|uniref:YbaK/EbsC family protein n=1 Tax=Bacillus sp. FSL K6-3431 TaxID=2921500 RepID=UPI0030F6A689
MGCSKVKLASPTEVQKVTGFEVGSVRMIRLDLPCVLDKGLFNYDFVYGGTGQLTFKIEPQA